MAICTSITKLETIDTDVDLMQVVIDNINEAFMLGIYSDCLQFIGQEVFVSYRKDVYKGRLSVFINTLTIPVKINTFDKEEHIKLFCEVTDNNSNVCLQDIKEGSTFNNAIVYCVSTKYESSANAVWVTYTVRDKDGRTSKVRLFDYDVYSLNYSGMYLKMNLRRTSYGFTTREVIPLPSEFPINPEVQLCRTYIEKFFNADEFILKLFEKTRLLDYMETFIAEERGYLLVRAATELDILQELRNVTSAVDFNSISYAIICRYGYLLEDASLSENVRSLAFVLKESLPSTVLAVLDDAGESLYERDVYKQVKSLADVVVKTRKVVL